MPEIAYTLPFLLLSDTDLQMADECFRSLEAVNAEGVLVLFNQGCLSNPQIDSLMKNYRIPYILLGQGENIGIPAARQACFEYVWKNLPGIAYVAEIHVDMIFTPDWIDILTRWLSEQDEPMIAPGILTAFGELHPEQKGIKTINVPSGYDEILSLLPTLTSDKVLQGLVHPVVHRTDCLQAVGGYDTRFLKGRQGYEDDSLLLGYRYYMGTRNDWKPKACLRARVFHRSLAQRIHMPDIREQCDRNLEGLIKQYGLYGLLQLSKIHGSRTFEEIAFSRL
jgi:hypothetical protein